MGMYLWDGVDGAKVRMRASQSVDIAENRERPGSANRENLRNGANTGASGDYDSQIGCEVQVNPQLKDNCLLLLASLSTHHDTRPLVVGAKQLHELVVRYCKASTGDSSLL